MGVALRLSGPNDAFQAGPPFGYTPQESGWRSSRFLPAPARRWADRHLETPLSGGFRLL